ncbi:MAG TPA: nucleotidyltransferase family protein, partial [Armatimonadota bacterium]|nr:nucleotidyltransferase family protein [Armatimonadota bacterium]
MGAPETPAAWARPEQQLLRLCARVRLEPAHAVRVKQLVEAGLDWDLLLRAARRHAQAPLLHHHLRAWAPEQVPEPVRRQLAESALATARRNLLLTGELLRLLQLFEEQSLPVVPFKGPVLTRALYGDLSLRPFQDLDLLVRKRDLLRCRDLLLRHGFEPEYRFSPLQLRVHLRAECEYNLDHPESGLHVELHWRFVPDYLHFPLSDDALWSRLQSTPLGGRSVPTLAPEDLLLVLCMHGLKHFWADLGLVADVAELLRRSPGLDWDALWDRGRRLGCTRVLLLGLHLAAEELQAPLPPAAADRLRSDPALPWLAAESRR